MADKETKTPEPGPDTKAQAPAPAPAPQAPALDIGAVVAQALIAERNARAVPVTATVGLDEAEREGGIYYRPPGIVVNANGDVIEDASPEHKAAAKAAYARGTGPQQRRGQGAETSATETTPVSALTEGA